MQQEKTVSLNSKAMQHFGKLSAVVILLLLTSCAENLDDQNGATRTVAASLETNKLGIQTSDLQSMDNPEGEGKFVYVSQTRFSGVERYILWLVIEGKAYPLNGATKNVIPSLPWPRDVSEEVWNKTGLNRYSATEAIDIVFGAP
jgi:hypothetical protein